MAQPPNGPERRERGDPPLRLAGLTPGRVVRISRLHGDASAHGKLLALGMMPGAPVEVVAAHAGGALVVEAGGRRLVLDRGTAELIELDAPAGEGTREAQPCA